MKIKLESAELEETEVIIRGDVTSNEVLSILQFLRKQNTGKLILYRDEEQYIVDPDEIIYIEACDNRVYAYTKQETYETKLKLYEHIPLRRSTKASLSISMVSSPYRRSLAVTIALN